MTAYASGVPAPRVSAGSGGALIVGLGAAAIALVAWVNRAPLTGFTAAFVAIAVVPVAREGPDGVDVFRPYYCVAALLFLYSIATPLYVRSAGTTYYGESVDPRDTAIYLWACLAAIAGLSIGTLIACRSPSSAKPIPRDDEAESERRLLSGIAVVIAVGATPFILHKFNPMAATSYADEALALRVRRMADTASGIRETLTQTIPTVLLLGAATIWALRGRTWPVRTVGAVILLLYIVTNTLSGWRGDLMVALLLTGVYFHYRIRSFRWHEVMTGGIAVYVLVNVLALARVSSDPRVMFHFVDAEIERRGYQFLALSNSGELATSTNLLRLVSGLRNHETSFGWGADAARQLASFVPRVVLPDRPDIGSERFVKTFYPGVLEEGGGYGFFMVQDGYWDFGIIGALIYCAIYGFLIERLYRVLRVRFQSDVIVLLYALLFYQLALSVVRSGIFASIKSAGITALPMIGILVAARIRVPRRAEQRSLPHLP